MYSDIASAGLDHYRTGKEETCWRFWVYSLHFSESRIVFYDTIYSLRGADTREHLGGHILHNIITQAMILTHMVVEVLQYTICTTPTSVQISVFLSSPYLELMHFEAARNVFR